VITITYSSSKHFGSPPSVRKIYSLLEYHCKKVGHIKMNCYKWKNEQKGKVSPSPTPKRTLQLYLKEIWLSLLVMNQAYALCVKTQIGWSTREPPFMFLQKGISLHPTSLIYYGVVRMASKDTSLIVGVGDIHVETNLDYNWYSNMCGMYRIFASIL